MLMMPPQKAKTRFSDWKFAAKSIFGFWVFYALTVVVRAFLGADPVTTLTNKLAVVAIGIAFTFGVYAAIIYFARGRTIRRKAVAAAAASVVASILMSATLILSDDMFRESKEEFRHQAREGFVLIEKGNQIRIERTAQEPLIMTLPKVSEAETMKKVRWGADAAVVWLFFFLAWSAYYLAFQSHQKAMTVQRRLADAESAAQAAQVRALRYQVNPHFLFNTLNSLSSLVMTGRTDRAETMLLALSTFFRTSLSLDPGADVTLAEEIELQRLYLDIEKARFPDRLNVEIMVPPELENARLPALILQPIVENAIKYGVSKSRKTVVIRIEAKRGADGRMLVEVSNWLKNGGTISLPAATHEGTGVGLSNVCQRLEARFGSRASCRFGPMADGGFKVALTIPTETND